MQGISASHVTCSDRASEISSRLCCDVLNLHCLVGSMHMCSCQNYGPFLGSLNNRCRIIIRTQKGTIILTTTTFRPASICTSVASWPTLRILSGLLSSLGKSIVILLFLQYRYHYYTCDDDCTSAAALLLLRLLLLLLLLLLPPVLLLLVDDKRLYYNILIVHTNNIMP